MAEPIKNRRPEVTAPYVVIFRRYLCLDLDEAN